MRVRETKVNVNKCLDKDKLDMMKSYTSNFVLSQDGTKIHYLQMGSGEGIVLVHGAMMYSENFMRLAELLANPLIHW